jgi:uroporphyrinogen-III synthase
LPQGQVLAEQLLHAGFEPILFPTIAISPVESAAEKNPSAEIVIFISPSAVVYGGPFFQETSAVIIAVGSGTKAELENLGFENILIPEKFSSEGLLAMPELQNIESKKVTVVKGEGGRELLTDELQARGAQLNLLDVYRRELPVTQLSPRQLQQVDVIIATSVQCLENLKELVVPGSQQALLQKALLVSSDRIAKRARQLGFTAEVQLAENASNRALLARLKT